MKLWKILFLSIAILPGVGLCWQDNLPYTGLVQFQKPSWWANEKKRIISLPQPYRRSRAIKALRRINDQSIAQFERALAENGLDGRVRVVKKFYLGNGAEIKYDSPATLEMLRHLPGVSLAIEDREGFRISESYAEADALDIAWGVSRIGAPSCWDAGFEGQNVIVAILDTGVRYTHQDLAGNMWHNPGEIPDNGIDDDGNGYTDDYYGYDTYYGDPYPMDDNAGTYHGTHCAGTVAGDGTGGTQTGVAPGAKIMAVKVLSSSGSGTGSALTEGIQYAVDNGAQVLSLSLGWPNPDDATKNYMRPVMEDVLAAGVVAAVAAGNERDDGIAAPQCIDCPGDCPAPYPQPGEGSARTAVIAVGATDYSDNIASFSSFGPTQWNTGTYNDYPYPPGLTKPDVSAPGVSIYSTYGGNDDGYVTMSGTSMATPHTAGAIAVLLSKNPSLTPRQIDSLLEFTALDLGDSGKDNDYGSGRIQLYQALQATPSPNYPVVGYRDHTVKDTVAGDGNGIIDPGESFVLIVSLQNTGRATTGVSATISTDNPLVSIEDDYGFFGDIGTGATASDSADPYVLTVAEEFTPGTNFRIFIHITDDSANSWTDTFEIAVSNYPHQVADFGNGTILTSVTNFGSFGFFDPRATTPEGNGFTYNSYNYLFGGGFFLGFAYTDVATYEGGNNSEFIPITPIESFSPGSAGDHEAYASFVDPGHRIRVDQKTLAWDADGVNKFVILRFVLHNISGAEISGIYPGFYLDYDIHKDGTTWYDHALWDSAGVWGYMWDAASPPAYPAYVGLANLTVEGRGSVVQNRTYRYASGMGWADTVKYNFLSGVFSAYSGDSGDDWSLIASFGPLTIAPGEADTVGFVVLVGDNSAVFDTVLFAARAMVDQVLRVEDDKNSAPENLFIRVAPNPFNSACRIEAPAGSRVRIFDIRGNEVASFEIPGDKGEKSVVWQPKPDCPAGIYIATASLGNSRKSARILFIK